MRVRTFTDPEAYIELRQKWGDVKESYSGACCYEGDSNDGLHYEVDILLVANRKNKKIAAKTLVHEAVHAVQFICEQYGISDYEFEAYAVAYIVEFVVDRGII